MRDEARTKAQLMNELRSLRKRITDLDASEAKGKLTEEALRNSEESFRQLSEVAFEGVAIHDHGKILLANTSFTKMFGYEMSEIIGKHAMDLTAPESRTLVMENIRIGSVSPYEATVLRKDGSTFVAELRGCPVQYKGLLVRATAIRDVTERKQIEGRLRESEGNFRRSFDESPLGIRIVRPDGETLYANRSLLDIFGCDSLEELTRTPIQARYTPESYAEREIRYQRRQRGEYVPPSYEISIVRKDGEIRRLEALRKEVLWNGERQFQVLYGDITEQKKLEDTLRESEQLYRAVVDNANDAIAISVGGIRVFANRAFFDLHGLTDLHEAVGLPVDGFAVPRDKALVREEVEARQRGDRSAELFEYHIQRADGTERAVEASASPVTYKGLHASMAVLRDITEHEKLEEALRESEQLYRAVVDNANDAMSISVDGIRVFVNDAFLKLHGIHDMSQAVGLPVEHFVGPEDKNLVRQRTMARQQGASPPAIYEYRIQRADGEERTVEVSSSTVVYKGQPAVLTVLRDVTERNGAQEQILRADKLASIGTLASGIVHEVNNPLAAVLGRVELLLQENLEEGLRSDLQIVQSEGWRAANTLRSLLTFAREHKPAKAIISLNDVLEATLELRAYEMRVNNLEIVKELQPDLPKIMADQNQMQQVFFNLVINAEQAMSEAHGRGTLTVRTRQAGEIIHVTIADDGPGIPPENLTKVFDPFFTTKPTGKGTGLGLSVCYGIVQAHGGNISMYSEMGTGATFVVELPMTTEGSATS